MNFTRRRDLPSPYDLGAKPLTPADVIAAASGSWGPGNRVPGQEPGGLPGGGGLGSLGSLGYDHWDPRTGVGGTQGGGGIGGFLGGAWDWIKDNPELILGVLSGIQGVRQGGKAEDLLNEALGVSRANFAARGPFREAVTGALEAGQFQPVDAPSFAAQFGDTGNPYNRISAAQQPALQPAGAPVPEPVVGGGGAGGGSPEEELLRRMRQMLPGGRR